MKLELAGDRLGAILDVGVRNDVAKLVTGSIYSRLKRWHTIWLDSVGGRRGEASSVCGKSDFHRGSGSGDRQTCTP